MTDQLQGVDGTGREDFSFGDFALPEVDPASLTYHKLCPAKEVEEGCLRWPFAISR
jgi:hypothetical protein